MPNQIWSRFAPTVIKKFIPRGKSITPKESSGRNPVPAITRAGYWLVPCGETSHKCTITRAVTFRNRMSIESRDTLAEYLQSCYPAKFVRAPTSGSER